MFKPDLEPESSDVLGNRHQIESIWVGQNNAEELLRGLQLFKGHLVRKIQSDLWDQNT